MVPFQYALPTNRGVTIDVQAGDLQIVVVQYSDSHTCTYFFKERSVDGIINVQ